MSFSDDEEFLSADEDNIDLSDDESNRKEAFVLECDLATKSKSSISNQNPTSEIEKHAVDRTKRQDFVEIVNDKDDIRISEIKNQPKKVGVIPKNEFDESTLEEDDKNSEIDREKNLKLARKFSAEIAKSVQASAPTPVKTTPPIQINKPNRIKTNDLNEGCSKSGLPPAPPPTPALSSSYSNTDDQPPSQFGWRVLSKSKQLQQKNSKICELDSSDKSLTDTTADEKQNLVGPVITIRADKPTSAEHSGSKSKNLVEESEAEDNKKELLAETKVTETKRPRSPVGKPQARFALDRLSESVSQSRNQNIFEKVVDDLNRVSIKTDQEETVVPISLPSITELGARLGGWGWGGVQTDWLMASASQVTSQVTSQMGSVLESVVNVAQQTVQPPQDTPTTNSSSEKRPFSRKDKDD